MSLLDLWIQDKNQLLDKNVQQIIGFAGEGVLHDGNTTSIEFREFLNNVTAEILSKYSHQCLDSSFNGSGYVLQDIVNEIGVRLGFSVSAGLYQGRRGNIGYDGIWHLENGHDIVIEVKTTDAYRIDLNNIEEYRRALIEEKTISERKSSVLIIVGRKDTGDLEAQIRGSIHAWSMRLISVDALLNLMMLKQSVEDPAIIKRMNEILVPREFTKLDEIIDIVFSTTEDVKEEKILGDEAESDLQEEQKEPVAYHQKCVARVENALKKILIPRSKVLYSTSNNDIALVCLVSKEYGDDNKRYWYGFHKYQKEFLSNTKEGYVALGCGSEDRLLLIQFDKFVNWLDVMNTTVRGDRYYWHVHVDGNNNQLQLRLKDSKRIELTKYLV